MNQEFEIIEGHDDVPSAASASVEDEREDRAAYAKARKTRIVLAMVLVILVILLAAISWFVLSLVQPAGVPDAESSSKGLTWVRSIYGWGKAESEQLYGPSDVAVGTDGTIWVADSARFQIVGFTPDGQYSGVIKQGEDGIFPQSFDVSEDNEIYVCDFAHDRIAVFSADNDFLREWEVPQPMEVYVRGDRVFVGSRFGVALYDTEGTIINVWGSGGKEPEQFDVVRGVAIGEDGTLYTSDTQNKRVKAYDEQGTLLWVYPETSAESGDAAETSSTSPFQIPTGMTFDSAGRLMLVDPFEFAIMSIDPASGEVLERWGDFGEKDGMFAYPTSLDYDPDRDWYVIADTANDRVQIVRIDGSGGSVIDGVRRGLVGPWWVCLVPLLLLLLAILLLMTSRKRQKQQESMEMRENLP